jgi:hypothetical protein
VVFRFDLNQGFQTADCASLNRVEADSKGHTGGRWYPTLVTLGNGDVLAISGHPGLDDPNHNNFIPELFTPTGSAKGSWRQLGSYGDPADVQEYWDHQTTFYPRVHLLPTGELLFASPVGDNQTVKLIVAQTNPPKGVFEYVCDFTPNPVSKASTASATNQFKADDTNRIKNRYAGYGETSVLFPLAWNDPGGPYTRARILIAGAEQPWILDLSPGVQPAWRKTTPRAQQGSPRRMNGLAVVLPTGEVFFTGGVDGKLVESTDPDTGFRRHDWQTPDQATPGQPASGQTPEIFDTHQNVWRVLNGPDDHAQRVRNYHSVALLQADGSVWVSGSDKDAGRGAQPPPAGAADHSIEIFYPWYYSDPDRPEILDMPDRFLTGTTFSLRSTQVDQDRIQRVVLVRCGSVTHAFNGDQRLLSLEHRRVGGDSLDVVAPPNGWVAPSGLYFVFTVNDRGLPSKGLGRELFKYVRVRVCS